MSALKQSAVQEHLDFWGKGVCSEPMVLNVLVERFEAEQHARLVAYMDAFLREPRDGWLHRLRAVALDREEGGIQLLPADPHLLSDLSSGLHRILPPGTEEPAFLQECQVRYAAACKFGQTTCKLLSLSACRFCPRRVMLELYRLFDTVWMGHRLHERGTRQASQVLGCGACYIMSAEGFPPQDDAVWCTNSLWHLAQADAE